MKKLISLKSAVGKTLTGVSANRRALFLAFGEDQFSWLVATAEYENEPMFEEQVDFPWAGIYYTQIKNAGIATDEELEQILREAEQKRIKASDERDAKEYERLKLKFERS